MRCSCCDVILNNIEVRLKNKNTGEYLDTCQRCLKEIPQIKVQYPSDETLSEDFDDITDSDEFVFDVDDDEMEDEWDSR